MSLFKAVLKKIEEGRAGKNKGIPFRSEKLYKFLPGIQRGTYYLIGGETSTGKTAFTDDYFLLQPFEYYKDGKLGGKLKIFYFTLEIDKRSKMTKAICWKLYKDHQKVIHVNQMLSKGYYSIDEVDDAYKLTLEKQEFFESMEKVVEFIDHRSSPDRIKAFIDEYAKNNGSFDENGIYQPKDPDEYVIIIIDHIGLLGKGNSFNKKEIIDKLDESLIEIRNMYDYIPVLVSQFNRDIGSASRAQVNRVTPQLSDFKDTGSTQEGANVVLALFNPHRYNIDNFEGFNIKEQFRGESFRSLHILKNRDGKANVMLPLEIVGEAGYFEDVSEYLKG